jgi:predicted nucleotidyltransferase
MRLTPFEVDAIKQSVQEVFGAGAQVFLFGSRVDDAKKGGDIDLYVRTSLKNDFSHKIKFLLELEKRLGEQKIDVLLSTDEDRPIERQAADTGILL